MTTILKSKDCILKVINHGQATLFTAHLERSMWGGGTTPGRQSAGIRAVVLLYKQRDNTAMTWANLYMVKKLSLFNVFLNFSQKPTYGGFNICTTYCILFSYIEVYNVFKYINKTKNFKIKTNKIVFKSLTLFLYAVKTLLDLQI